MTREELLHMAIEAGMIDHREAIPDEYVAALLDDLERYTALVIERCAKACDNLGDEFADANPADCAAAIRALK